MRDSFHWNEEGVGGGGERDVNGDGVCVYDVFLGGGFSLRRSSLNLLLKSSMGTSFEMRVIGNDYTLPRVWITSV